MDDDPRELELRALVAAGEHERATEETLKTYGPELVGWLCSVLASEADAHDAFSRAAEELWRSLPRYAGRCSLRTWCYMLARHAAAHVRGRPSRQHELLVSQIPSLAHAVTHIWNTTRGLEQQTQDVYAELRASLSEEDQTLLALRVDRDLQWREIAQILLGDDASDDELQRKAASVRKQFERIKDRMRELAEAKLDS